MPNAFVNYGSYSFSICNLFNVKIKKIGLEKEQILQGDGKNRLTHIAVENNFLFCLRIDRKIIQWDYKKGEIVQEIESEYFKRNDKLLIPRLNVLQGRPLVLKDNF